MDGGGSIGEELRQQQVLENEEKTKKYTEPKTTVHT
jgi:hypothetical protein